MTDLTFIETQFPVSKLSKESYKERKSHETQTLTSLGKWWGRKPLILVRATLLGLLFPASRNPRRDREIFLKILTMDDDGFARRCKGLTQRQIFNLLTEEERKLYFEEEDGELVPKLKDRGRKEAAQALAISRLSYDDRLEVSYRPEEINGPSEKAWREINAYLGTEAPNLAQLFRELGVQRFGHIPRVGDAFSGGGSIPFEAARLGLNVFGSDLNPVGALLTWASLHLVGGGKEIAKRVRMAQERVYAAVDRRVRELSFETNEQGWRADAFFYCTEVICPESGWRVPLAPSWVIGRRSGTIARLIPDTATKTYRFEIEKVGKDKDLDQLAAAPTVQGNYLVHPMCSQKTAIRSLRDRGALRLWEKEDIVPRPDDVFQERLYGVRWLETTVDNEGKLRKRRHYRAPDEADLERERQVETFIREHLFEWQAKGYIPSRRIEPGDKTDEPIRTRGWTHWHHLYTPRQLLVLGLAMEEIDKIEDIEGKAAILLALGKYAERNSKLCGVDPARDGIRNTFSNQALNTNIQFGVYGASAFKNYLLPAEAKIQLPESYSIEAQDARKVVTNCDIWITDPPYADAINYHELSEYFLAWYDKKIPRLFPGWYSDSKRALAITGSNEGFRRSMVECYKNLVGHMPDNGLQIVMFTHQDAGVWADLALILWAAGLRVTAAWTIATETESALKEGNYVQGTVLMVLRKQTSDEVAFLDEIVPQVETEVEIQLKAMLELDDQEDPNFSDADYQLAAYAAALRILTQYKGIEELDAAYELSRERARSETSPIEKIIEDAVKTASNFLVPAGIHQHLWKRLSADEKFYLKGLEVESHGDFRSGVYQEFARGLGVREYQYLLSSGKANQTRLKTASEFRRRELGSTGFGSGLLRNILFAVFRVAESDTTREGMIWLKTELADYWGQRENLVTLLRYLASLPVEHWHKDAAAARLLAGTVENDHV
jgi:putative DNA methylase